MAESETKKITLVAAPQPRSEEPSNDSPATPVAPEAAKATKPADGVSEASVNVQNDLGLTAEELDELRAEEVAFSWKASEYVHHHKGVAWYAGMFGILTVLIGIAAFFQAWLTIGLFIAMGAAIVVYAKKPPRTLLYELTPTGITVEGRVYPFTLLRSFSVHKDTEWHSIDLEPTKRLMPRLTVLFDESDYLEIVGHLELHLPQVERRPDMIERASRYLRF